MKLFDIGEDGKVVVALWIAEKMLIDINNKDEDYIYCRESVDLCWKWLINRNVSKDKVVERVSNDSKCISKIVLEIEDIDIANQYGAILICLSYVAWQAYNYEEEYRYPQDLECVNDEYLEELIGELIDEGTILENKYEKMLTYIADNYSEDKKIEIKKYIVDDVISL